MANEKKVMKTMAPLILLWILLGLIAITGITFAWFNFRSSTNVISGRGSTITNGDGDLLIGLSRDGQFDKSCQLVLSSRADYLDPLSTDDLVDFYRATGQNTDGMSIFFDDDTANVDTKTMNGRLYLKSEGAALDVYLFRPKLDFGAETQALASLRLGLRINAGGTTTTHIFKLDSLGNTVGAEEKLTIPNDGMVIASLNGKSADYVADPARAITDYCAMDNGADDTQPRPGMNKLCSLARDEIAEVSYWLYLEGCDINCINAVQTKEVALQLGFAGIG